MNGHETKARELIAKYRALKLEHPEFLRPLVIELTGTPSSGKTSVITALTRFFKRNGWRTLNPLEGAEATKLISRGSPLYNLRTFSYALDILLERTSAHDYELVFLDRGLYDFYCWARRWFKEGKWSEEICRLNQQFALQPKLSNLIDLAIFATCRPDVAMARERDWALTAITGETTNPDTITRLIQIWHECFGQLQAERRPVHIIDTTLLPPDQVGQKILELILETIEKKLNDPKALELS